MNENENNGTPVQSNNSSDTGLTQELVYQMAGALARLEQLKTEAPGPQIVRANGEAVNSDRTALPSGEEAQALVEFMASTFLAHSAEFIGTWFAMRTEYSPLLRAMAPVMRRAASLPAPAAPLAPDPAQSETKE